MIWRLVAILAGMFSLYSAGYIIHKTPIDDSNRDIKTWLAVFLLLETAISIGLAVVI